MKKCSKCQRLLDESCFAKKKDKLQSKCKECNSDYQKNHYVNNKDAYATKARLARKTVRARIARLKEKTPCADCDRKFYYFQMDFDHVRGKKNFNVSEGVQKRYSWNKIQEEIKKCEIVCSLCHKRRTHKRLGVCYSTRDDCCNIGPIV